MPPYVRCTKRRRKGGAGAALAAFAPAATPVATPLATPLPILQAVPTTAPVCMASWAGGVGLVQAGGGRSTAGPGREPKGWEHQV